MNHNACAPASPVVAMTSDGSVSELWHGLTKRELFAAMAMQGWCAAKVSVNGKPLEGNEEHAAGLAEVAVIYADALLAALDKEPK